MRVMMKCKHPFIFRKGTCDYSRIQDKWLSVQTKELVGENSRENSENMVFQMRWKIFGICTILKVPCTIEN